MCSGEKGKKEALMREVMKKWWKKAYCGNVFFCLKIDFFLLLYQYKEKKRRDEEIKRAKEISALEKQEQKKALAE